MLLAAARQHRSSSSALRSLSAMLATSTITRPASNGIIAQNGKAPQHTVTALKRWSCDDKNLPPASEIKAIHVYDFDNTLFASPTPNKQLWSQQTLGQLALPNMLSNGGWWHDSNILAATGEGIEKEEARAWAGWWNEQIVSLVELSMQQKDALNVLLTGRSEHGFSDLIKRMVRSKKLDFDMVCLKPNVGPTGQRFGSTMEFKQELLKEIVYTYTNAEEIRIYEDRPKHTQGFRDFFFQFNKDLMAGALPTQREAIVADVVQVAENATALESVAEIAEIQRAINAHNKKVKAGTLPNRPPYMIKKTVFFTGYMISSAMSEKLATLVKLPQGTREGDVRYLANSILITPRPCPPSILDKAGGLGAKVAWKVVGLSCFENKIWAAKVEPVPKTTKYYTENPVPTVVLALRKNGRPADAARIQNWHPVPEADAHLFETVVGEKCVLRIEEEQADENDYQSAFSGKAHSKARREDNGPRPQHSRAGDDRRPTGPSGHGYRGGNRERGRGGNRAPSYGARGGRGGGSHRGDRGGGGRGRGRNGMSQYKSLDDVDKGYSRPNYDEADKYY